MKSGGSYCMCLILSGFHKDRQFGCKDMFAGSGFEPDLSVRSLLYRRKAGAGIPRKRLVYG
jgi:hypothetical protein